MRRAIRCIVGVAAVVAACEHQPVVHVIGTRGIQHHNLARLCGAPIYRGTVERQDWLRPGSFHTFARSHCSFETATGETGDV